MPADVINITRMSRAELLEALAGMGLDPVKLVDKSDAYLNDRLDAEIELGSPAARGRPAVRG